MSLRVILPAACLLAAASCDISGLVLPLEPGQGAGGEAASHRALVDALGRVAGAREVSLLKALVTRRLGADLERVDRGPNSERFWSHLRQLQQGIRSGTTFPRAAPREDGRRALPLHFNRGGGAELIIKDEDGRPRIDRF